MGLDIHTPKGQRKKRCQDKVFNKVAFNMNKYAASCPDSSLLDGFFYDKENYEFTHAVEVKCRTETREQFREFGSLMISAAKYDGAIRIARDLSLPFIIILSMGKTSDTIVLHITNEAGQELYDVKRGLRKTMASVNGGEKIDNVVYIPLNV